MTLSEKYLKIKQLITNEISEQISDANDRRASYLSRALLPNQSSEQELYCRLPKFRLVGHTNHEPIVKCRLEHEWGYLKNNRWYFNYSVITNYKNMHCKYRAVYRIDDQNNNYTRFYELYHEQKILDEVIEVVCVAIKGLLNTKVKYSNLYVQIVSKLKETNKTSTRRSQQKTGDECKPLNIILLSYDSLSRVSWFKRLPKTTEYLLNKLNFKLMYGQSIMGDGTPACMIPLLSGTIEQEMPSTLKSDPNASFVDQVYPFIWNDLHAKGYMSFHMEDWPQVSAFTYRLKGMV